MDTIIDVEGDVIWIEQDGQDRVWVTIRERSGNADVLLDFAGVRALISALSRAIED